MEEMQVQRYSTEVKIYITATVILAVLIVGLVWWNSEKAAQRDQQLKQLYAAYQDLGTHINNNLDSEGFAVCKKPVFSELTEEEMAAADPEELKTREQEIATKQAQMKKQAQQFQIKIQEQFDYLQKNRPPQADPELMTDVSLFRLNKTYNEFAKAMGRFTERCGDLTDEQVNMRQRRYDKLLARFTQSLKDLEGSNN